ncbi:hypothetical protein QF049_004522 [Paenibacillus sp. W4I10]|uniref:hypothetical protein n=1 Tax=Paenibacillus sp. W4I10 TaxID=3042298 RepID=UPI00277DEEE2|nr:hypothetical protein [Paenibacillus sp. W4I10]MDQ0723261.1 hypothetical protein [Paenibacillus sp. W4I10]
MKKFADYKYEDLFFKLSLYQRVDININNFTRKTSTAVVKHYGAFEMDVYETHYSSDFAFRRSLSDSTIKRKIDEGIESVGNTLKLIGFFEQDDAEF